MIARQHLALVSTLLLLACGDDPQPPQIARFERPSAVDFVCVTQGVVVSRSRCKAGASSDFALHALVTQSARGEIAAVDLTQHKVLDSRRDIPGFTYVAAGELPIAIIVPAKHPWVTYVADFGGRDIRVLDTQALVTPTAGDPTLQVIHLGSGPTHMVLSPDEDALVVTLPDVGSVLWLPISRLTERCARGDRKCREGLINDADKVVVDLKGSLERAVAPAAASAEGPYQELCGFDRPQPLPAVPIALPASNPADAAMPSPAGLAIDAFCRGARNCQRRLLVADEASPLIHRIDLDAITPGGNGSDALLDPIVVGVPTSAVAITPFVPTAVRDTGETQYIYAIDATDGSVLVVENGLVLNLDNAPGVRPDRITLASAGGGAEPSAVALAVSTPAFDVNAASDQYVTLQPPADKAETVQYCENLGEQSPARLRGVFLAAAMSDGTIRIVDVHDMELGVADRSDAASMSACEQCRGTAACRECPSEGIPWLVRNHARLASSFRTDEAGVAQSITPSVTALQFETDGLSFGVRADGSAGTPKAPHLDCITCDSDLAAVTVGPEQQIIAADEDAGADVSETCDADKALLCSAADPWTASEELWAATYEGTIKGAAGGQGRFELVSAKNPGELVPQFTAEIDFCSLGVLGAEDIGASYREEDCDADASILRGDQLVVTSEVFGKTGLDTVGKTGATETKELLDGCAKLRRDVLENPASGIAFNIRRAYSKRLIVDNQTTSAFGSSYSYDEVTRCLGTGPLSFAVHTRGAFTVEGARAGFQHRVIPDGTGRCVVDPKANPLQQGRARMGCTFRNQGIAFRLHTFEANPIASEPPPGLRLFLETRSPATKLLFNASRGASIVPTQIQYNDIDQRLYLLDSHVLGLLPISLDPFPYVDPRDNYR